MSKQIFEMYSGLISFHFAIESLLHLVGNFKRMKKCVDYNLIMPSRYKSNRYETATVRSVSIDKLPSFRFLSIDKYFQIFIPLLFIRNICNLKDEKEDGCCYFHLNDDER